MTADEKAAKTERRSVAVDVEKWPELATLVDQIVIRRNSKGWTQSEFAKALGMSQPYVSAIERHCANPSYLVIAHMARVLGVSVSDLTDTKVYDAMPDGALAVANAKKDGEQAAKAKKATSPKNSKTAAN